MKAAVGCLAIHAVTGMVWCNTFGGNNVWCDLRAGCEDPASHAGPKNLGMCLSWLLLLPPFFTGTWSSFIIGVGIPILGWVLLPVCDLVCLICQGHRHLVEH